MKYVSFVTILVGGTKRGTEVKNLETPCRFKKREKASEEIARTRDKTG